MHALSSGYVVDALLMTDIVEYGCFYTAFCAMFASVRLNGVLKAIWYEWYFYFVQQLLQLLLLD